MFPPFQGKDVPWVNERNPTFYFRNSNITEWFEKITLQNANSYVMSQNTGHLGFKFRSNQTHQTLLEAAISNSKSIPQLVQKLIHSGATIYEEMQPRATDVFAIFPLLRAYNKNLDTFNLIVSLYVPNDQDLLLRDLNIVLDHAAFDKKYEWIYDILIRFNGVTLSLVAKSLLFWDRSYLGDRSEKATKKRKDKMHDAQIWLFEKHFITVADEVIYFTSHIHIYNLQTAYDFDAANPTKRWNIVQYLVETGNVDVCQYLLRHQNFDFNPPGPMNYLVQLFHVYPLPTVAMTFQDRGPVNLSMLEFLLRQGRANPNYLITINTQVYPLSYTLMDLCFMTCPNMLAALPLLVENGLDFNFQGTSPPMNFVLLHPDKAELVAYIVRNGGNIDNYGRLNATALCLLIARQRMDDIKILLDNGADYNWKIAQPRNPNSHDVPNYIPVIDYVKTRYPNIYSLFVAARHQRNTRVLLCSMTRFGLRSSTRRLGPDLIRFMSEML